LVHSNINHVWLGYHKSKKKKINSGNKGKLLIDGNIKGESEADGTTKNIEVNTIFHLGGLPSEKLEVEIVKRNLMVKNVFMVFLK